MPIGRKTPSDLLSFSLSLAAAFRSPPPPPPPPPPPTDFTLTPHSDSLSLSRVADRGEAAQFTSLPSSLPVSLAGNTRSVAHYRREILQGVRVSYDHFRLVQLTSKFDTPPPSPIAADWVWVAIPALPGG